MATVVAVPFDRAHCVESTMIDPDSFLDRRFEIDPSDFWILISRKFGVDGLERMSLDEAVDAGSWVLETVLLFVFFMINPCFRFSWKL